MVKPNYAFDKRQKELAKKKKKEEKRLQKARVSEEEKQAELPPLAGSDEPVAGGA
ncbi:MAG: hypothetical protein AABY83_11615 [Pseudomonadota bacterium]